MSFRFNVNKNNRLRMPAASNKKYKYLFYNSWIGIKIDEFRKVKSTFNIHLTSGPVPGPGFTINAEIIIQKNLLNKCLNV